MIEYLHEHAAHLALWFSILSLSGFVGSLSLGYLAGTIDVHAFPGFDAWLRASRLRFAWAFGASLLIVLVVDVLEMTGKGFTDAIAMIPHLLVSSRYGWIWLLKVFASAGLCLLAFAAPARPGTRLAFVVSLLVVVAFTFSATSHSANDGVLSLTSLVHVVHVTTIVQWAGAIVVFAAIAARFDEALLLVVVRRYSRYLMWVGAIAVVSGLVLATSMLNHIEDLWVSSYGQVLLGKLTLVAGLLGLAIAIRAYQAPSTRAKLVKLDGLLIWLVLLVATQLAHVPPPY